jgi:hypothetical protein
MIRSAAGMLAGHATNPRDRVRGGAPAPWVGLGVRDEVRPGGLRTPAEGGTRLVARGEGSGPLRLVVIDRLDPDGPAARAGLQRGDVLVRVGDVAVASSLDLPRGPLENASGDHVPVVVRRGGAERRVEVVVEASRAAVPADLVWNRLGLRLQAVSTESVSRTHPQLHGGLLVADLRPTGPATRAGIQRGDVVVGLDRWEMLRSTGQNRSYKPEAPARVGRIGLAGSNRNRVQRGSTPHAAARAARLRCRQGSNRLQSRATDEWRARILGGLPPSWGTNSPPPASLYSPWVSGESGWNRLSSSRVT